jgi:hypothetical protein
MSARSRCSRRNASKTVSSGIGSPDALLSSGRKVRTTLRSALKMRSMYQLSASGSASSRSVSAVGAQSTTITSQRPERTWSRTSSSASTSSAPGNTVSSSASIGSTPITFSTERRYAWMSPQDRSNRRCASIC